MDSFLLAQHRSARGLVAKRDDDQIGGLAAIQASPRRVGFEDAVQTSVAPSTQRGQVVIGLVAESGVTAVMEVVATQ
jgi:hypothetical protein